MNTDNNNPPFDADEQLLDQQLRRSLPVKPPADLAERIFAATVHALRDERSSVIARIDSSSWTRWTGWRYAAALGLVIFYAALWARPHVMPTTFTEVELARADRLIAEPQTYLDTSIDTVAQQLDAITHRLTTPFPAVSSAANSTSTANSSSLAKELYQLEASSF